MQMVTKEVTEKMWRDIETLFGANGACGGCWCQAWRIEKGEQWSQVKGSVAKRRLHSGISKKTTHGILAFSGNIPIGWCTFGPRDSFPRINRAPTLKCRDSDSVWSVPCFFVSRDYRDRGVATRLLRHAIKVMKRLGTETVEGYPTKPGRDGRYISAFSWTGTRALFSKAGFVVAGNRHGSKQRVRKNLSGMKSSNAASDR